MVPGPRVTGTSGARRRPSHCHYVTRGCHFVFLSIRFSHREDRGLDDRNYTGAASEKDVFKQIRACVHDRLRKYARLIFGDLNRSMNQIGQYEGYSSDEQQNILVCSSIFQWEVVGIEIRRESSCIRGLVFFFGITLRVELKKEKIFKMNSLQFSILLQSIQIRIIHTIRIIEVSSESYELSLRVSNSESNVLRAKM